jgi:hypothetical protein
MTGEQKATAGGNLDPALFNSKSKSLLEFPLMSRIEVRGAPDSDGIIDCRVPIKLINHEEVPVDKRWASSLASQMHDLAIALTNQGQQRDMAEAVEAGTGQLTPILLGLIEGEKKFRIIDGFHRDAALIINGVKIARARVMLTDWNELYDIRIFTAKDHDDVKFSRVVRWINEVWRYSGLANRLSVEQAILLYRYDTSGSNLGLTEEEVVAAREWVAKKEKLWEMPAMTMRDLLVVAGAVDPTIVQASRKRNKKGPLEAPTKAIIDTLSKNLPGDFALQEVVVKATLANQLSSTKVTTLCQLVKGLTKEEAVQKLAELDWETLQPTHADSHARHLRQKYSALARGALVLDQAAWEIHNVSRRADLSFDRQERVTTGLERKNVEAALSKANLLADDLGKLIVKYEIMLANGNGKPAASDTTEQIEGVVLTSTLSELNEHGLRNDIIEFLSNNSEAVPVGYEPRQVSACYRYFENLKDKAPLDWRKKLEVMQRFNTPLLRR